MDAEATEVFHSKAFFFHITPSTDLKELIQPDKLLAAAAVYRGSSAMRNHIDATLQSAAACNRLLSAVRRMRGDVDAGNLAAAIEACDSLPSFGSVPQLLFRLKDDFRRLRRRTAWDCLGLRRMREVRAANAAAKGAYIMVRDMETVRGMVRRVQDEAERISGATGRLREQHEMMKEMEASFEEGMEELEGHVLLCLQNIQWTSRLLAQAMLPPDY